MWFGFACGCGQFDVHRFCSTGMCVCMCVFVFVVTVIISDWNFTEKHVDPNYCIKRKSVIYTCKLSWLVCVLLKCVSIYMFAYAARARVCIRACFYVFILCVCVHVWMDSHTIVSVLQCTI